MLHGSPLLSLLLVLLSLGAVPLSLGQRPVSEMHQPRSVSGVQHRLGAPLVPARAAPTEPLPPELADPVKVIEVLAPDKVVVRTREGQEELVRLLGVDAISAPGYLDAVLHQHGMALLARLSVGRRVRLVLDPRWQPYDADGDLCAWLVRSGDGLPINLEMVRRGYLLPSAKYPTRWQQALERAAAQIRVPVEEWGAQAAHGGDKER